MRNSIHAAHLANAQGPGPFHISEEPSEADIPVENVDLNP